MPSMQNSLAQQLFDRLIQAGLRGAQGSIACSLLGSQFQVIRKSSIGDILQEWLGQWMTDQGIDYRENQNTQTSPDFYLSQSDQFDLLELKTFDYNQTPSFDIANFDAFVRSLEDEPYRLDADYLILGYTLHDGLMIQDIWLKKIWELACPSEKFPVKVQQKQAIIYNLRPYNFKTPAGEGFSPFATRADFLTALYQTLLQYEYSKYKGERAEIWLNNVQQKYRQLTGQEL